MFNTIRLTLVALMMLAASLISASAQTAAQMGEVQAFNQLAIQGLIGSPAEKQAAVDYFVERGGTDMISTLVLMLKLSGESKHIAEALKTLTGEDLPTWHDAMLWQEAHPEIQSHPSYQVFKLSYFNNLDSRFLEFFNPRKAAPGGMKIRFEEITWGGVRVDGIPSLDRPTMIKADEAYYLNDDDLVFGISINGDKRAYPLRIMGWHEMFNDVIGGVPVALAYCTLCGSGILFETQLQEGKEPLIFGSSGFLYRSNKLMFDRATKSLWNQFTGEPVVGPLTNQGIKLKIRPNVITSWSQWRKANPQTSVLSLKTGFLRDYGSGVVYRDYFSSPDLMFPTIVRDENRLKRKDYVFGIRDVAAARAWPISAFEGGRVINDKVGLTNIVLIGDSATRTVRAYERKEMKFKAGDDANSLVATDGGKWRFDETVLTGPAGETFARMPGHISYWFAWDGYMGVRSSLFEG
ncbi:MAG: DUF3179 domain-containing protein [Rhizobiaceae bacterium]